MDLQEVLRQARQHIEAREFDRAESLCAEDELWGLAADAYERGLERGTGVCFCKGRAASG